jgi:hypothetical protein
MASKRENKIALAKARREKAFSAPIDLAAAAKKQMGVTVENDRVTDFGTPTQDDGIVAQMLRRYSVNIPKGAYAVGKDTLTGGEAAYKPAPTWMRLLYGSSPSTDMLYNLATNEKFSDALAPTDLVGGGLGGIAKGALKIATSKGGKAAIAGLIAGEASGLRDTEEVEASPIKAAKIAADRAAGLNRGLKFDYPEVQNAVFDWLLSESRGLTKPGERIASRFSEAPIGQSIQDRVSNVDDPNKTARWLRSITSRELKRLRTTYPELAGLSKQEIIDAGYIIPTTARDLSGGVARYAPLATDIVSSLGIPSGAMERPVVQHLLALAEGGPAIPANRGIGGNLGNWAQGTLPRPEILKLLTDAGKRYGLNKSTARDMAEGIMSIVQ